MDHSQRGTEVLSPTASENASRTSHRATSGVDTSPRAIRRPAAGDLFLGQGLGSSPAEAVRREACVSAAALHALGESATYRQYDLRAEAGTGAGAGGCGLGWREVTRSKHAGKRAWTE